MQAIRLVDITGSAAALILLSPLLVLLAVLLKFATSGPVFCIQERVRPDGRHLRLLKFCPRRTGLGVVLHRFSVDELPGLINVLLGEVSLRELRCFQRTG